MLAYSAKLLIHYLKFWDVPVPVSVNNFSGYRFQQIG
jgi:hypothetical protein